MTTRLKPIAKRFALGLLGLLVLVLLITGGALASFLYLRSAAQAFNSGVGRIVDPGGIDTREFVTIGGVRQWITIRGQNAANPLLLYLHGGPGGTVSEVSYIFQRPWEDFFTVVQWDQRGFGGSAIDAEKLRGTVDREQVVSDTIELVEYLRKRFGQQKVVLVGQSWGTVLGATVAKRRPDLVYAYIGIGQLVEWEGNFNETRRLLSEHARETGDAALQKELDALGPPPPATDAKAYLEWADKVQDPMIRLGYSWHNLQGTEESWGSRLGIAAIFSESMTTADLYRTLFSPPNVEESLYGILRSLAGWTFERDVGTTFDVPVVFAAGRYDWQTPTTLVDQLYPKLCNTNKTLVHFEHSAHVVVVEEPGRMLKLLLDYALPATTGAPAQGMTNVPCGEPSTAVSSGMSAQSSQ